MISPDVNDEEFQTLLRRELNLSHGFFSSAGFTSWNAVVRILYLHRQGW